MMKVTAKNFIQDFVFLSAVQTLSIGRHGLVFSTKTPMQISLSFFKRYLNSDYRKVKYFFFCPQTVAISSHFVTSNYFNQIFIFSNYKSRTRTKGRVI